MANGVATPAPGTTAPGVPNVAQMLGQLATSPPIGPIPTTPYAQTSAAVPPGIAPVYQPPALTGKSPYTPPPPHSLGQNMGNMGIPAWLQQLLLQRMMNPFDPRGSQGGGSRDAGGRPAGGGTPGGWGGQGGLGGLAGTGTGGGAGGWSV